MDEAYRHRITGILQSEAEVIALAATAIFTSDWVKAVGSESTPPFIFQEAPSQETTDAHDRLRATQNLGEIQYMIRDGYVRLGGVIALSVFTDQPGLIADDLRWLRQMFSARNIPVPFPAMFEVLLRSYVRACAKVLGPEEVRIVTGTVERAREILEQEMEGHSPGY